MNTACLLSLISTCILLAPTPSSFHSRLFLVLLLGLLFLDSQQQQTALHKDRERSLIVNHTIGRTRIASPYPRSDCRPFFSPTKFVTAWGIIRSNATTPRPGSRPITRSSSRTEVEVLGTTKLVPNHFYHLPGAPYNPPTRRQTHLLPPHAKSHLVSTSIS